MPISLLPNPRAYVWGKKGDWRVYSFPDNIQVGGVFWKHEDAVQFAIGAFGADSAETFRWYPPWQSDRYGYSNKKTAYRALMARGARQRSPA